MHLGEDLLVDALPPRLLKLSVDFGTRRVRERHRRAGRTNNLARERITRSERDLQATVRAVRDHKIWWRRRAYGIGTFARRAALGSRTERGRREMGDVPSTDVSRRCVVGCLDQFGPTNRMNNQGKTDLGRDHTRHPSPSWSSCPRAPRTAYQRASVEDQPPIRLL